jgi:glycosyltransferase involved in cell wall biosynthesis
MERVMSEQQPTRRKIKVLFFEAGRQGGSVFRLLSIITHMNGSQFDIGVVSYYRDRAAASLFEIAGLFCRWSLNVPWYPQPDTFKPLFGLPIPTPFGIYFFLVSLLVLWRHRPDVAYMNSGIGDFGPAILAARLVGTKVVCHLRMSSDLDECEVRLARHVQHLVASSQWGAKFYEARVGGRVPATCVYEAIDLVRFDARAREPLDMPLPEGPTYLCQVGTLVERKRPALAVEAFELARRQNSNLRLVLVGDGPLRLELETLVRQRGLQSDVLLLGQRKDVPALLRHCHIGLLLSESEGLPNAVLEYMASGLPVLVTRLPFIDEIVRDQHNGLVVNEASPSAVAHAMLALGRSAEARARMGSAGRAMIEDGVFHPDHEARGTESLLTRVVAAREVESSFDDPGRVVARRR